MKTLGATVLIAIIAAAFGGCASMPEATTQEIQLSVMPETAQCDAYQHGLVVGRYDPARRAVTVPASQGSMDIVCSAPGYKNRRVNLTPGNAAGTLGKLTVDFGPLATYVYPATIDITMEPADRPGQPI